MRQTILIAGAMAQQPHQGGMSWFFLQFLLGFRRLGWDVLMLDRLDPDVCVDAAGRPCDPDRSVNLSYFRGVMARFGLSDAYSLALGRGGGRVIGRPRDDVLAAAGEAALLLNVMAYLDDEAVLARVRRRVFLDIDPGFPQMWRALGLADVLRGHDSYVTLGRNIGRASCPIPTCGLAWVTMPQPVVLEHWPAAPPRPDAAFTSIGAWRGGNGPVDYQGRTYGLRAHEFRRFATLPRLTRERFEMALDIHPAEVRDLELLGTNGWAIVNPKAVAGGPEDYRAYVAGSKAEFMVPKHMYVATNSGLLSDRSAYYLASGRPVLARDTGVRDLYPTGEGLLTFSTLDEAVAGVEAINADYARHCRAARGMAEAYFDSDKVLAALLEKLGVG